MATVMIDRKQLSAILREQLSLYNKAHPENQMNYDILFEQAKYYYLKKSKERYCYLNRLFDTKINQELLEKIEFNFKRWEKGKQKIHKGEFPEWSPLAEVEDFLADNSDDYDAYMNGDYYLPGEIEIPDYSISDEDEFEDYMEGEYLEVTRPSALFYALARIMEMDEDKLIQAFYTGDGLNIEFYNQQFVYDVFHYYFIKSGKTQAELAETINQPKFSSSKIGNLVTQLDKITFEHFEIIAPSLQIPDKLSTACKYRLAQSKDPFSYQAGYEACMDDYRDHPDEMEQELGLVSSDKVAYLQEEVTKLRAIVQCYDSVFKEDRYILCHKLYQSMGFSFEPYAEGSNIPENIIDSTMYLNFVKMKVTLPNSKQYIIDTKDYLNILDKASDYAEYLLWKCATHPEKPTKEETSNDTGYINPDSLI